ncbi:hypothetical protein [Pontibacillus salipaludis]|uniref:YfhE-like protein n=1 Tax=Pontibacillus salipaludis TaxID=1697394 RepID=A0ABQ1PXF5_9BACI|nr:hypothetical protein [Pontibacillus salipaludis]GGD06084.1 hypothetical protein GCM10011389_12020 [Pontibacillus salipaludis]
MNKDKETKKPARKEQPTSLHEQFINKAEKTDRKTFDREGFLGKGY